MPGPWAFGPNGAKQVLETRRSSRDWIRFRVFSRRHREWKPNARQRFCYQLDVHPRCEVLQLPRRPWHGEQCRSPQAVLRPLPSMPRLVIAQWPTGRGSCAAHASCARLRGQRMRRLPHAENPAHHCGRQSARPHLPFHCARNSPVREDAGFVYCLPYRQNNGMGGQCTSRMARIFAMADEPMTWIRVAKSLQSLWPSDGYASDRIRCSTPIFSVGTGSLSGK